MRRTWVVTGCYGFLGRELVQRLLQQQEWVYGIDLETYAARPIRWGFGGWGSQPDSWAYRKADIASLDWLPDCDVVVNCAAETHVDNSITDAASFIHTNVLGTHRLLELVRAKRGYRMPLFLQISTDEVYGSRTEPATTTTAMAPRNPYAASKAAADHLVSAYAHTHGVPASILRMTNLYGVGQYPEKLIPKTVRYLMAGKPVPVHGVGDAIRQWLLLADAARAVMAVGRASPGIYHAGGNTHASVHEVVTRIAEQLYPGSVERWLDRGYERPGLDESYALADEETRALGWVPVGDFWSDLPGIVEMEKVAPPWVY